MLFKQTPNKSALSLRKLFIVSLLAVLISSSSFYLGVFLVDNPQFITGLKTPSKFLEQAQAQTILNRGSAPKANFNNKLFWQVYNTLQRKYVDQGVLTDEALFYGALRGMAEASGDPYTIFMTPEENKEFHSDVAGKFEGIGAEIGLKDDVVTIISPLDGMPAQKAGLMAGDMIMEIDGVSTLNMSVNDAVKKIRGDKGTEVTLTILRSSTKKTFKVTIKRGVIVIKSVKYELKDKMAIIKVNNFNETTEKEFNDAVTKMQADKAQGVILDLRNNPGGLLNTSIAMAGRWVGNDVVLIERFSQSRESSHKSLGAGTLQNFKTVVLINEGSASASEIVAGALQDYGYAVLVGKKSYGKGSVQSLEDFSDGSSVKITTSKWLTPKGRAIDKIGIEPDVVVELKEEDVKANRDPQLLKALEVLKNYDKYLK